MVYRVPSDAEGLGHSNVGMAIAQKKKKRRSLYMKRNVAVHGLAILLVAVVVGGCGAGKMIQIPATYPDGERLTIVAHNQIVPDWMVAKSKLALNFIVKGDVSEKQLAAVATTEGACRIYTKTVRPHDLVAVASYGVLFFGAGFAGGGIGSQVFPGVNSLSYGTYVGTVGGATGAASGTISLGGKMYTFENCGANALNAVSSYGVRVLTK